jgi:calcium-dependent protein kinase
MGQMIDKVCCINDITFAEANDDQSNYSNGSRKSEKSTKKEKAVPNTFRVSLSERRQNKNLQAKDSFYHRASIAAPSSEIILLNPDKKGVVKNISNLPIGLGTIIRKNNKKPNDNYIISKSLGEGGFGSVIKVIHKNTGQVRAMKIIPKNNLKQGYTEEEIFREINILKKLEHPYIMKLYEFYSDEEYFYLINEFCSEGDLSEKLQKVGRFEEKLVKLLMFQIFSAVWYLHSNNVIHGDLKLENVMIDNLNFHESKKKNDNNNNNNLKNSFEKRLSLVTSYKLDFKNFKKEEGNKHKFDNIKNFEIKLIDFGAAKIFTKYKKQFDDTVGTLVYCSPEVLKNNYDSKCDIWSCAVIMYILLSGEIPFAGDSEEEIIKSIMNKKVSFDSSFFNNVSEEAKDLIQKCLIYNKSKRYNAKEALDHPFFKIDIDVNNLFQEDLTVEINQVLVRMKNFSTESKFHQAILVFLAYNYAEKRITERLKHIFFYINKSLDGRIKPKELLSIYQENNMKITKDEVLKIIKSVDFNNSGAIEYEEFIRIALPKEDLLTEINLKEAFDLFDINKTGNITVNEMKEVLGMDSDVDENVVLNFINDLGYKTINYLQFRNLVLGGFE